MTKEEVLKVIRENLRIQIVDRDTYDDNKEITIKLLLEQEDGTVETISSDFVYVKAS